MNEEDGGAASQSASFVLLAIDGGDVDDDDGDGNFCSITELLPLVVVLVGVLYIQEEHCQTLNIIIRQGWFFMAVYIERTFLGVVRIVLMGVCWWYSLPCAYEWLIVPC